MVQAMVLEPLAVQTVVLEGSVIRYAKVGVMAASRVRIWRIVHDGTTEGDTDAWKTTSER